MIIDANAIITMAGNGNALVSFLRKARQNERTLYTTDAIVAQVWRGGRDANIARALKAMVIETAFGDGRSIGLMCVDEAKPDVVDASLAWWAKRKNVEVLSDDPDVHRYAEKIGARFQTLDAVT